MSTRNNTNTSVSYSRTLLPIRDSLARAVLASAPPTPRKGKKRSQQPRPSKIPDWWILEARRLREQQGMRVKDILATLIKAGVPANYYQVNCWCKYTTRGHLIPPDGAKSYIPE